MHLVDRLLNKSRRYKNVFETDEGRWVLADIAKFCQHNSTAFVAGDPNSTSYILGKQRVIRRIQGLLNQSDEDIKKLVKTEGGDESYSWDR